MCITKWITAKLEGLLLQMWPEWPTLFLLPGIIWTPFTQMGLFFSGIHWRDKASFLKAFYLPSGSQGDRVDPKWRSSNSHFKHHQADEDRRKRLAASQTGRKGKLYSQALREQGGNSYSQRQSDRTIHNTTGEEGQDQWDLTPKGGHFKNAKADITCSSFQSHSQRD